MIKRLVIQGYRSLKHIDWQPEALNVIIGENCSGKSNLLKALELLSQSINGRLRRYILSEGGTGAIVWNNEPNGAIEFELGLAVQGIPESEERPGLFSPIGLRADNNAEIVYRLQFVRIAQSSDYEITDESLPNQAMLGGIHLVESRRDKHETQLSETFKLSYDDAPGQAGREIEKIKSFLVYQSFRSDKNAPVRSDATVGHEISLDSEGENLVRLLHTFYTTNPEFRDDIDDAFRVAFPNEYEGLVFPPTADTKIQLQIKWKSMAKAHSTAYLSDGTLRYLYLMAILLNPAPPPLICIDEPETGLHPSMFPLVAEAAQQAAMRTQVILTTHSPEFLNHFSEEEGVVSVMYLKDGASQIKRLQGEPLKTWLESYKLGRWMLSGGLDELARDEDE